MWRYLEAEADASLLEADAEAHAGRYSEAQLLLVIDTTAYDVHPAVPVDLEPRSRFRS